MMRSKHKDISDSEYVENYFPQLVGSDSMNCPCIYGVIWTKSSLSQWLQGTNKRETQPVSYTHLDVYKRQDYNWSLKTKNE